jgi:acid phosphatase (class A)
MKNRALALLFAAALAAPLPAQTVSTAAPAKPAKQRIPNYLDPTLLDLSLILPPPPLQDSAATQAEIAEVRHIEQTRTPEQVAAAQYDDHHEDIFLFSKLMGESFTPEALPLTAALSARVRNDAGVIDNPLKQTFLRPRPYNFDTSLHPVCDTNKDFSYPSGHSLNGYLFAFTLIQLVPEKRTAILARADEYAHNRVICEAHYASDLEASRRIAYVAIGAMLANPRFQHDLAAARTELRQHLNLSAAPK